MTRNEAIQVLDQAIEKLAPTTGHKHARRAWINGARAVVRGLISAGAFEDGRNWEDRLPLQPYESEEP
jgi:hypothetical protein